MPKDRPIDPTGDSVHLRAGAQHGVPVARARLGRGPRRARHRHRRQRARLLGLSRLPARVHRGVRAAGHAGDREGRAGRALPHPRAAADADQGRHHPARPRARPRLRPDAQLLRPGPDGRRAAAATAACCARRASPRPASPIRARLPRQALSDAGDDRAPLLHRAYCARSTPSSTARRRASRARPRVVLDRTAFYPTSGGQPFDTGRLGDDRRSST